MSKSSKTVPNGRVAGLWWYPVKSMAAEALREVDVSWSGFAGDRRWSFLRNNSASKVLPWFTLRQRSDMAGFSPAFSDPTNPETPETVLETPSGEVLDITDASLGRMLCPEGAQVMRQSRGVFDTFPLSLSVFLKHR